MGPSNLSIGEVGRRTGLRPSAIRFYEQAGVLPKPDRVGGQRRYTIAIVNRLTLIEYAKSSGFKLEEIRRLFHGFRDGMPISARWQQVAKAKLVELDNQVRQIQVMKGLLEGALRCRCVDLDECGRVVTSKENVLRNFLRFSER